MNTKDYILLTVSSLLLGAMIVPSHTPKSTTHIDTPKIIIPVDTIHNVKGKKALFIGDSHSAYDYGWQYQVCHKTGMEILKTESNR